jgi:signal transduction histidine kinase
MAIVKKDIKSRSKSTTFEEFIYPTAKKHLLYGNIICAIIFLLLAFADPPQYGTKFISFRILVDLFLIVNVFILFLRKSNKPFDSPFIILTVYSMFLFNCPIVFLAFKSDLAFAYVVGYYIAVLSSILTVTVTNKTLNLSVVVLLLIVSVMIVNFHETITSENLRIVIHFYTIMFIAYIFGRLFNASRVREYESITTINNHLKRVEESESRLKKEVVIREETEQNLRKIQEKLKAKNRDILEFTNMVTHDLKKPLTCFNSVLQILESERDVVTNDYIKESLSLAKQATLFMENLLEDLLDYAKWDTGAKELDKKIVDVGKLVDSVINQLKVLIDLKCIKVTRSVNAQLEADERALTTIFMNLIGNAVSYIGDEPNRTIDISSSHNEETNEYTFYIKDTGIGIPKNSQGVIFDKFKRGSNALDQSGTGLGLPIVKSIIEAHKGSIWFESTEGEGTVFNFILPG